MILDLVATAETIIVRAVAVAAACSALGAAALAVLAGAIRAHIRRDCKEQ